jgi:uncharacterized membrane protein
MQEDKKLKEFLMKHAVEETTSDFTNIVMQRIQISAAAKISVTPLLKQKLLRILMAAFLLVFVILLVLSISMQPLKLPFHFSVKLPAEYFSEIISFLIAFWVVMIINLLWTKKRTQVL